MLRRIAPAIGLFFLSPFVGEFLLGNASIDVLPIGLVMAPMYGGGAVLIRETARRAGKGWPTLLLLAGAFGVVEEGLVCQTLFNPSYFGFNLLREAYLPSLGMGVWWTLFVLTLHTVWSISVPIAIVESLVRDRATSSWLGWFGLAVVAVLYVLGCGIVFSGTYEHEHFVASRAQLLGTASCAAILTAVAFTLGEPMTRSGRAAPGPWPVGIFALLAASLFMIARMVLAGWPLVFAYLLVYGLVAVLVVRWSGRAGWGAAHRLALAGGALLTYAWHSFPESPVLGSKGTIDLIGNVVFSVLAVILLFFAARNVRRQYGSEDHPDPRSPLEYATAVSNGP